MKNKSIEKTRGFLNSSIRSLSEEDMKITHCISTNCVDRYDTVVLPRGCDISHFLKNPVVLWLHNMDNTAKIPIGRCIELDIRDNEILATTEFNKNDPLAVKVFNAYRDGFLSAWSIGFMPKKYKEIDEENFEELNTKYGLSVTRDNLENSSWGTYLIYEWELMEYSAVPVPGNPEALNSKENEDFRVNLNKRGLMEEDKDIRFNFQLLAERKGNVSNMKIKLNDSEVRTEDVVEPVVEEAVTEEVVEETVPEVVNETVEEEVVEPVEEAAEVEEVVEEAEAVVEPVVEEEVVEEVVETPAVEPVVEKSVEVKELENKVLSLTEQISQLTALVQTQVASIDEVKKSFDANNIEKVREASQKKTENSSEGFFSNYLRIK